MTVCIDYKDIVTLVDPSIDGYSNETIGDMKDVKGLFIQSTGWSHSSNNSNIDSDAYVYIDHSDEFVIERANRLEGILVVANPFGYESSKSWYRVVDVQIGQDKLLCNKIDNVLLSLKKSTEIGNGI